MAGSKLVTFCFFVNARCCLRECAVKFWGEWGGSLRDVPIYADGLVLWAIASS